MPDIFRGVRARDWVLTLGLGALGVVLMWTNITADPHDPELIRPMSTQTWWMLPAFLLAIVPVLWWRRSVIAVSLACTGFMVLHDVLFGWVTRCGAGLPLVVVLTYLGAIGYPGRAAWLNLAVVLGLSAAVTVLDASAWFGAFVVILPVVLVFFVVGRVMRDRAISIGRLEERNRQLRQLRDERAAWELALERERLSRQLDTLVRTRLGYQAAAAERAAGQDGARARAALADIEAQGRSTLDDMRGMVGLLRGGEATLTPTPTVAHLTELLAGRGGTLNVTGDPRTLPATVELSAYRIVEHLVTLAEQGAPLTVEARFDEAVLVIRIDAAACRQADVKAAVARARERARLLNGTVNVTSARRRLAAVAELPV